MSDSTIQRSEMFTLPEGDNHVGITSWGETKLYAAYYAERGAITVHMGTTSMEFTPQQWTTIFAAVAAVSPRAPSKVIA